MSDHPRAPPPMEFKDWFKDWVPPDKRDRQWRFDVNAATWAFQKREAERRARKCVLSAFSVEARICLEHLERVRTGTVDTWVTTQAGYFELSVLSNALFADRLVVQEK